MTGTGSAGVIDAMPLAWIVAVAAAALTVWRLSRPDARAVIDAAPRGYRLAFGAGAALLLVQLVPLTVFIIAPTVATWRPAPWTPMPSRHACSTAYWMACEAAAGGDRLYDEDLYSTAQPDPAAPRIPRPMGPVGIDPYEYPPSFLPVPALLRQVTGDYWGSRRLWFALTLAAVAVVAVLVARRLDRAMGTHALWLTPYLLTAPTMIATLHMGNVQLAALAAALAAMLLFERGRYAAGGLALGYVTAGKLFPGRLVVYLLLRREWRARVWTAAWAAAFALASRPAVVRATVAIVALVSLSWGIGFLSPLVNASWTTAQTIAAVALVAMACLSLRESAPVPAHTPGASELVSA